MFHETDRFATGTSVSQHQVGKRKALHQLSHTLHTTLDGALFIVFDLLLVQLNLNHVDCPGLEDGWRH